MKLKIKDDVDLKELEKFGFKMYKNYGTENFYIKLGTSNNQSKLKIMPISRELIIDTDSTFIFDFTIIYDLIQAGLVEKVEG